MDLSDIYRIEGIQGLRAVAERASVSPKYLYQLATRFQGRRCSPSFALRLAEVDPRLSVTHLVFGSKVNAAACLGQAYRAAPTLQEDPHA